MLLRIHDVQVTTRHVEIPPRCGACGAPVGPAIELNLSDGAQAGTLVPEPDEPADSALLEFTPDRTEAAPDEGTYFVVGYRCRACGHLLARGEFTEQED
jgi:hypothetical protein